VSTVRVLVVRAAGINCDEEIMHCWGLAGAAPTLLHVNELAARPRILEDYAIVTIPGGFSYGDDLGAGVILAQRMRHELSEPLHQLIERGGGILGVCNGFQALVKMGLLPGGDFDRQSVTVTYNDSARFEARWVKLQVCTDKCPFLQRSADFSPRGVTDAGPPSVLELPVEHAEGKVVTAAPAIAKALFDKGQVAVRYVDEEGRSDRYPANPNGSTAGIAGLCDATGRIFGLMPHPDRHFDHTQHPLWTCRSFTGPPDGLRVFQHAVDYWRTR
jgi:phosphoribosylformylglycinamidine synthase